jgi:rubrerythrin
MRTTIDSYKTRAGRLDLGGIDFDDFRDQPLPSDALRSLRYMHDVEHHTVCYLRDLLLTPAHQDPAITSFLSCWVFEEMWHGEAIGQVLEAHGEEAGAPRIAALRHGHRRRQAGSTFSTIASAAFAGRAFIALHMTWGAINEWTTQAGYARLAETAGHPTLRELLRRIMKQEGGHIDFYASEAARRL